MLKNFLYLNSQAVDSYLSALEDGLRHTTEARSISSRSAANTGDVASTASNAEENIHTKVDTATARFERLQASALANPATSGWIEVTDPDNDLRGVRTGSLLDIQCEIYVPQIIQALSPTGGIAEMIGLMKNLAPHADSFDGILDGMPEQKDLRMMEAVSGALGNDLVMVGENDDTDWRFAGRLLEQYREGEIEGVARVVGKVTTSWGIGRWKPLISLPGMNILGREQRRELERTRPTDDGQTSLEGPAYMLDVLAIYR